MSETKQLINTWQTKSDALLKSEEKYKVEAGKSTELPWLKTALLDYQNLTTKEMGMINRWPLMLAGFFLISAILLEFARQPILAISAIFIGSAFGYFYIYKLRQLSLKAAQNEELNRIAVEFQQKFNRQLTSLPALQVIHDEQYQADIAAKTFANQMNDLQIEITQLEQKISDNLFKLTGLRLPKENWSEKVNEISENHQKMKEQIGQLKIRFASLQVEEAEFQIEPTNQYDDEHYKKLEQQVKSLEIKLSIEDKRLNSLRQSLAQETRQDFSTPWDQLIAKLQAKRAKCAREYQDITAKVIAGIMVNSCLDELYKEEEKHIHEGLSSSKVADYLNQMTTHYNRIEFNNGVIRVADPYSEYTFNELSTATQEQVLLALRLGFSSRCFYEQSMFLVLDDAFQHSDWNRRESLIDCVLNVAKLGWQIIYLTMDDQIRDLFREKAETSFPNDFSYVELENRKY